MAEIDLTVPRHFSSALVIRAFKEVRCRRWVLRQLRAMNAIVIEGGPGRGASHECDSEVIRAAWPTIYARCVELILEERMAQTI